MYRGCFTKKLSNDLAITLLKIETCKNINVENTRLKVLELTKLTIHAYGFSTVA